MIGVIMLLWPVVDAGQNEFEEERTKKKKKKEIELHNPRRREKLIWKEENLVESHYRESNREKREESQYLKRVNLNI